MADIRLLGEHLKQPLPRLYYGAQGRMGTPNDYLCLPLSIDTPHPVDDVILHSANQWQEGDRDSNVVLFYVHH